MQFTSPETLGFATAILTLVAAIYGVLQFVRIKSRREQQAEIRSAFALTVQGLSSDDPVERMVAAILLRRFYDRNSEFSLRPHWYRWKHPIYPVDTTRVLTAMLRQEPTGPLQKLLAEGLAYAPSLVLADLQQVNLTEAFLGHREGQKRPPIDMSKADLFGADLSGASLRGATARSTVFYRAKAVKAKFVLADVAGANFKESDVRGAVFSGANLRDANFTGAVVTGARFDRARIDDESEESVVTDLTGANFKKSDVRGAVFSGANLTDADFTGALVEGAEFKGARIGDHVLAAGVVPPTAAARVDATARNSPLQASQRRVFLSVSNRLPTDKAAWVITVEAELRSLGVEIARVLPGEYSPTEPLGRVRREIETCQGVVVLALAEYATPPGGSQDVAADVPGENRYSTVWNQIEAGIAVGMGRPVLVLKDDSKGGVLELPAHEGELEMVALRDWLGLNSGRDRLRTWCEQLQVAAVG